MSQWLAGFGNYYVSNKTYQAKVWYNYSSWV